MSKLTRDDVKVLSADVPGEHRGVWWHIQIGETYYIISAVDLRPDGLTAVFDSFLGTGMRTSETMAFEADADAAIIDWSDLAMVPFKDHWACIDDLLDAIGDVVDGEVVDEQPAITAAQVSTLDGGL